MATLIELARRLKAESGRSGIGPASVATAVGEDLQMINAVRDVWTSLQLESRNWTWMRRTKACPLASGVIVHTPVMLTITDLGYFAHATDDYCPTAFRTADTSQEWDLWRLPYEQFRRRFLVGEHAPGVPQCWCISPEGNLLIGPTTESADYSVRIDYFTTPTDLVDDADTPEMPAHFHNLLLWQALLSISASDAAPEQYGRARDKADDLFDKLIAAHGEQVTITARPLA